MSQFVYHSKTPLEFPLSEEIEISSNIDNLKNKIFLISNTKEIEAEAYTKDVDFYINNTKDPFPKRITNVAKLYEAAALKYDFAQDIPFSTSISNSLLMITNNEQERNEFKSYLQEDEFDMYHINVSMLKDINGKIGDLNVDVVNNGKDVQLNVAQIVWFDAKELGLKQSGTFDPNLSSIKNVIEILQSNIAEYQYKKYTTYDSSICQYHERREEVCAKCEEVCPTTAILKNDTLKHLEFSQIDCHGCGGCISVCPSGALDYAATNRESLFEVSKLYKESHPLIIPEKMDIENLAIDLKEGILPFSIEGEKFLHEASLLTLAQISGSQLVFYSDFLSKGTSDAIRILNDIYQKKYGKDCIIVAMDKEELSKALEEVSFVEESYFNIDQTSFTKRETFAMRLKHLVDGKNLGVVTTGEHIHYAKVKVNESNCTLCLSCVGACNVGALIAEEKDHTLRLNPSLCTSCGYCELSCPESDCLTIERDIIELEPNWFKENIVAQDSLFACVQCGKEFATTKAIEKIAMMMAPMFASDPAKEKTLYCCSECKPKVMMQSYYDQKVKGAQDAR